MATECAFTSRLATTGSPISCAAWPNAPLTSASSSAISFDRSCLYLSSELLTWLVGNLSAFWFKTGGCDHIMHLEQSAWEERFCFVECNTKGFEDPRPVWRTERGELYTKLVV